MAASHASTAETAALTQRVAMLSVAAAFVLSALKAWSYASSNSVAMLASLADSGLDLVASLFTLIAVRYAAAPPDREHRFGHGKAEAFAGLIQAGLVAISCVLIALEAVHHLRAPVKIGAPAGGLVVMAISTLVTAAVIWVQGRALRQTGSVATKGDRAHYASDLASNVAVMIGIVGAAYCGLPWIDAAAGLVVAAGLAWGAWTIGRDVADQLLDRELPREDRERIKALALAGGDIRSVHELRTRAAGPYLHVQFHADVAPNLSLVEAHHIVVEAENRIRAIYPKADVLIHPDPGKLAELHGHEDFEEGQRAAQH